MNSAFIINNEISGQAPCAVMSFAHVEAFLAHEVNTGADNGTIRRLRLAVQMLYDFLPPDKEITRERLLAWRANMNEKGYAAQTVQNYVKWINTYLDYAGLSEMRFQRGKSKNIAGVTFGYIMAIAPTEKRYRRDVVWLCRCKCGTELELPASRLIANHTLSCGCIQKERIKRVNRYFEGTSLKKSLKEDAAVSQGEGGFVGVSKKRDKWRAYITYKKQYVSLGVYDRPEDAAKARARAKEAVMEDAAELLKAYQELHRGDAPLPQKATEPKRVFPHEVSLPVVQLGPAKRSDNKSGYTGIYFRKNKWEAQICYHKTRYVLGRFEALDDAVAERVKAEAALRQDPEAFVRQYAKEYQNHAV